MRAVYAQTYIIGHILPTSMEEGSSEVAVRHLQGIVDGPQRRSERITDAGEATARRRVRLEHQERLAPRLCEHRGVEVRLHLAQPVVVRQVRGELCDEVQWLAVSWEDIGAVLVRVAAKTMRLNFHLGRQRGKQRTVRRRALKDTRRILEQIPCSTQLQRPSAC